MINNRLIIILGPTASGKTRLAVDLALDLGGEVISADSRQVFRGMDIGTGKDLGEYQRGGCSVPYHLIDHKEAGELYNVQEFKDDFYQAHEGIIAREALPVLCGGTGMYIHSLLQKQDYTAIPVDEELRSKLYNTEVAHLRDLLSEYPEAHTSHADRSSHKRLIRAIEIAEYLGKYNFSAQDRPVLNPVVIGLELSVESRRARIASRLQQRLKNGLIEEVQMLLDKGISKETLIYYGLEYKFVTQHLIGMLTYKELEERLIIAIQQFAKRQMTFFRKMEKDGVHIHWLNADGHLLKDQLVRILEMEHLV